MLLTFVDVSSFEL